MNATSKFLLLDLSPGKGWSGDLRCLLENAGAAWRILTQTLNPGATLRNLTAEFDPVVVFLIFSAQDTLRAKRVLSGVDEAIDRPILLATDCASVREFLTGEVVDFLTLPFREAEVGPRASRWLRSCTEERLAADRLKEKFGMRQFVGESPALLAHLFCTDAQASYHSSSGKRGCVEAGQCGDSAGQKYPVPIVLNSAAAKMANAAAFQGKFTVR